MRTYLRGAVAAIGSCALVYAQGAPQPSTTFRTEINYVQIPVRVLDARGEFVSGLTQSDFHIFEDGQPQVITSFRAVEIPSLPVRAAISDVPITSIETVADEPVVVDGRVYAFVLDNQSMRPDIALRTRHVVRTFLRNYLQPNDVTAVVFTGTGRGQPFTRNRRLLDGAIDRFVSDHDPTDHSTQRTMTVIADTARSLGVIQGRRKALVLMSTSPLCSIIERDETSFCREDARYALRAAMQSDVSIYTIEPGGLNTSERSRAEHANPNSAAGIDHASNAAAARSAFAAARSESRGPDDAARYLAEESGGFAAVNTNSLPQAFARVVRENSSYYLLGYYSSNTSSDGKTRRNVIRVGLPGVRVVHRAGYVAAAADVKGR